MLLRILPVPGSLNQEDGRGFPKAGYFSVGKEYGGISHNVPGNTGVIGQERRVSGLHKESF